MKNMEDLTAEIPSNEKSCQTDDLEEKSTVLRPEHLNLMPAYPIEPGDPSLLQRQLQTSKSGIQQIIECFSTGTTQLKNILLKEVDTIFECKLCRSLFRGLPNLITHKKFFCFTRKPESEALSGSYRQNIGIKELLEVTYPRPKQAKHVVRLEPIPGNQNAVFQHLTTQSNAAIHSPSQSSNHSLEDWKHNQPEGQGEDLGERNTGEESKNEEANEGDGEAHTDKDAQGDEDEEKPEEVVINGGIDDVNITCCLCSKNFSSWRSVRRHCREVHKQKLEELHKFMETHTVPTSLLSVVKECQEHSPGPSGKCCPVCFKTFATKANVRRHFDEVHRGLRRDLITLDISTKSSDLEVVPAGPCGLCSPNPKIVSPLPQYNLATGKCLLCKRSYSTQARLKRPMDFVHKILAGKSTVYSSSTGKKNQSEEGTDTTHALKRLGEEGKVEKSPVMRKSKLTAGFDFKQLFCKLCKRQFSSRQNLTKHIVLHTDNGGDIFIKFYRCPMCRYESRRKRDVLRHVAVMHKKNSAYLAKILPGLESHAVRKPAETVLGTSVKHGIPKNPDGHHKGDTTSSHSLQKVSPLSSVPPVIRKQDVPPPSPPVTRRQSLSLHTSFVTCKKTSNGMSNGEEAQDSTEVRVAKNASLHTCDVCGHAFNKKVYLESHKRSHHNAAKSDGRTVGVSTRSKSLLW